MKIAWQSMKNQGVRGTTATRTVVRSNCLFATVYDFLGFAQENSFLLLHEEFAGNLRLALCRVVVCPIRFEIRTRLHLLHRIVFGRYAHEGYCIGYVVHISVCVLPVGVAEGQRNISAA